ncbi:hypothetical protein [Streptomyces sp. SID11385]|uniref:hypothetical protein n=1 Tax=Streptomyces sp. SID11385 TaxID=2706031 RepID=UPI0013C71854|nr:hypothetical protein [Streptomyces sp. SID11385]NEA42333.1 hypothetical protein [Streptomyces sp. SID11385]
MPSFSFCLYTIGVNQLHRQKSNRPVAEFNSRRHDLFDVVRIFFEHHLGAKGISNEKDGSYIRLTGDIEQQHRSFWPTLESGHFGTAGKVVDTTTGDDTYALNHRDAPTYPLRQFFTVPRSGDCAIWATEVAGNASAITPLWNSLNDWFRSEYDADRLTLNRAPLQNTDAWNDYIDASELQQIKFLTYVRDSDAAVGMRTKEFTAKSGRGKRLPKEWITRAYARDLPPSTVFHIQGLPDADEIHLQIEHDGKTRNIIVEREFPRFLYPVGEDPQRRPDNTSFQEAVLSVVSASLDDMGVSRGDWQA